MFQLYHTEANVDHNSRAHYVVTGFSCH